MSLAELPQLQTLSPAEKLELIGELWDSLEHPADFPALSNEVKALLDQRLAADDANPEATLTPEEFEKALDQQL